MCSRHGSCCMLLIVAVSLFPWGCTVTQQTSTGAKSAREVRTEEQEARRRLEWARAAAAEQDYEHARAYYQEVLDRRSLISPAQILTQAEYVEALDGVCAALTRLQDYAHADNACARAAAEPSSQSATIVEEGRRVRKQQLGVQIDHALQRHDIGTARQAVETYKTIPGAKPEKITIWEKQLRPAEKRAQEEADRLLEKAAQARAQAEQEAQRRREEQSRLARERLADRWGWVRLYDQSQLQARLLSYQTVMGAQFFSGVEIEGKMLHLWVPDIARVTGLENLSSFADIADMFPVWCDCDGVTTVGMDMRHLGGSKQILHTFRLNPQSGRSQVGYR